MDVVTAIEGVLTDGRDKPIDAVRVESITIAGVDFCARRALF